MFLTDLQEKLRDVQTERGNVPLSIVHVMHGETVLAAHADVPPSEDGPAETERPKLQTIAEAEASELVSEIALMLAIPLEQRLARCEPGGALPITVDELTQLLEYRDELKASYMPAVLRNPPELAPYEKALEEESKLDPGGAPVVKVPEDANMRAIDCLQAHEDAQAKLGVVLSEAAAKLPPEAADDNPDSLQE